MIISNVDYYYLRRRCVYAIFLLACYEGSRYVLLRTLNKYSRNGVKRNSLVADIVPDFVFKPSAVSPYQRIDRLQKNPNTQQIRLLHVNVVDHPLR